MPLALGLLMRVPSRKLGRRAATNKRGTRPIAEQTKSEALPAPRTGGLPGGLVALVQPPVPSLGSPLAVPSLGRSRSVAETNAKLRHVEVFLATVLVCF